MSHVPVTLLVSGIEDDDDATDSRELRYVSRDWWGLLGTELDVMLVSR